MFNSYCIPMSELNEQLLGKLYSEVINVRHLLEFIARSELKKNIELIATTGERRKVYCLLDGLSSTEQIAQKAGVSQRAVQIAVKDLTNAGLVTSEKRGFPKRIFDYIPSEWEIVNDS
jgi:DNA-binding transcriptional ArsR family regulator